MNGKVRILSIVPYQIFPAQLGGEKGIAVFNQYLSGQVALTVLTIKKNDPSYATYKVYNTISNHKLRYANILLFFRVRKLLKLHGATHLLIEHPYYAWLAWMIRETSRVRWVVHSHNMEYMRSKSIGRWWWKALKWYEGWAYRAADKTFYISEDDMNHAVDHLGADPAKGIAVTYGIEQSALPHDLGSSRLQVLQKHGISADKKILLFNGALYHSTNYDALRVILEEINPFLLQRGDFPYVIVVCGRGLPESFNDLREYAGKNVIYAGFVDDISVYFKAADVFLNPILTGGGVKTKAIEALAMNCAVVSTPLGALGLKREVCGGKLRIVPEGAWQQFAEEIVAASLQLASTPPEYYQYYYWKNIIKRAVNFV